LRRGRKSDTHGPIEKRGWKNIFRWLTWVGGCGCAKPDIGQMCVVMKGKVIEDEGQMAVVTGTQKVMVEIAWNNDATGQQRRKLKQPQLLMMLEEGLCLEQAADGAVWVRRMCHKGTSL
jgi:hypothetical protein